MQRQRARAVEQQHVPLLKIVKVAGRKFVQQVMQLIADTAGDQPVRIEHLADLASSHLQFGGGVSQQRGKRLQGLVHYTTSIGVFARFGVPNRLVSLTPPEQPLPNEKPQEPRKS